jgi:hypothetical protein
MTHRHRQLNLAGASVKDTDLMAVLDKPSHNPRPDEPGSPKHQHTHHSTISQPQGCALALTALVDGFPTPPRITKHDRGTHRHADHHSRGARRRLDQGARMSVKTRDSGLRRRRDSLRVASRRGRKRGLPRSVGTRPLAHATRRIAGRTDRPQCGAEQGRLVRPRHLGIRRGVPALHGREARPGGPGSDRKSATTAGGGTAVLPGRSARHPS